MYDSTEDTQKHIQTVQLYIEEVVLHIQNAMLLHDISKLLPPEKALYDEYTPKLSAVPYGSDEYKQYLKEMGEALQHHYQVSRHHPEHFENGINGMTLVDIVEMLCDWKSATLRVKDGNLQKSLEYNKTRFQIDEQLYQILKNTVEYFGW
jgi:hypothetical protein